MTRIETTDELIALTDIEIDAVSGGAVDLKGASEALTQRAQQDGKNDPAQMFQQIMQQLTQGQGQG